MWLRPNAMFDVVRITLMKRLRLHAVSPMETV
jgi:hypothetical protein